MKTSRVELRACIPATLNAVEDFCHRFRSWHTTANGTRNAFAVELLLREALANGVAHSGNSHGSLECVVRGGAKRLVIAVSDGGCGFDWRQAAGQVDLDEPLTSSRGIAIYHHYADRVRFNESGNTVTLVKFFTGSRKDARNDFDR